MTKNDRYRFFNNSFNLVYSELSINELLQLTLNKMENCKQLRFTHNILRLAVDDAICFYNDDNGLVSLYKVLQFVEMPTYEFIKANDFIYWMNELCNDIDHDYICRGDGCYLTPVVGISFPLSHNTLLHLIKKYFITNDGTINHSNITEIKNITSEFDTRVYPVDSSQLGWDTGCFEFKHNSLVYKIRFSTK